MTHFPTLLLAMVAAVFAFVGRASDGFLGVPKEVASPLPLSVASAAEHPQEHPAEHPEEHPAEHSAEHATAAPTEHMDETFVELSEDWCTSSKKYLSDAVAAEQRALESLVEEIKAQKAHIGDLEAELASLSKEIEELEEVEAEAKGTTVAVEEHFLQKNAELGHAIEAAEDAVRLLSVGPLAADKVPAVRESIRSVVALVGDLLSTEHKQSLQELADQNWGGGSGHEDAAELLKGASLKLQDDLSAAKTAAVHAAHEYDAGTQSRHSLIVIKKGFKQSKELDREAAVARLAAAETSHRNFDDHLSADSQSLINMDSKCAFVVGKKVQQPQERGQSAGFLAKH